MKSPTSITFGQVLRKSMHRHLRHFWNNQENGDTTQAEKNHKFLYFAFFSKPIFKGKNWSFPPFSRKRVGRSSWNFFCRYFKHFGVCIFFWFVEILLWKDLVAFTTGAPSRPSRSLQYFASHFGSRRYFSKKNTHPILGLVIVKKFQPDRPTRFEKKGGKLFTMELQKPSEGPFWQIWVYDKFWSFHRDVATLKFSEIFAEPFAKNAGRGGGSP